MTKTFNMKQKAFFIIFRGLFIKYSQTTSNSKITKLKDEIFRTSNIRNSNCYKKRIIMTMYIMLITQKADIKKAMLKS